MNNDELIKRARELASLRNSTTPKPWKVANGGVYAQACFEVPIADSCRSTVIASTGSYRIGNKEQAANARLMAAATEMAVLLEQMADRLNHIEDWARSICAATCKDWPAGKHAPNCPVTDIDIDEER